MTLCDGQRDGTASNFEDKAAPRAQPYHAYANSRQSYRQLRKCAGGDEHDASSRERALNAAAYEESCNPLRSKQRLRWKKTWRECYYEQMTIAPREETTAVTLFALSVIMLYTE